MKKRFNLWLDIKDIKKLKQMAKKEGKSVNSYILSKVLNNKRKGGKR